MEKEEGKLIVLRKGKSQKIEKRSRGKRDEMREERKEKRKR